MKIFLIRFIGIIIIFFSILVTILRYASPELRSLVPTVSSIIEEKLQKKIKLQTVAFSLSGLQPSLRLKKLVLYPLAGTEPYFSCEEVQLVPNFSRSLREKQWIFEKIILKNIDLQIDEPAGTLELGLEFPELQVINANIHFLGKGEFQHLYGLEFQWLAKHNYASLSGFVYQSEHKKYPIKVNADFYYEAADLKKINVHAETEKFILLEKEFNTTLKLDLLAQWANEAWQKSFLSIEDLNANENKGKVFWSRDPSSPGLGYLFSTKFNLGTLSFENFSAKTHHLIDPLGEEFALSDIRFQIDKAPYWEGELRFSPNPAAWLHTEQLNSLALKKIMDSLNFKKESIFLDQFSDKEINHVALTIQDQELSLQMNVKNLLNIQNNIIVGDSILKLNFDIGASLIKSSDLKISELILFDYNFKDIWLKQAQERIKEKTSFSYNIESEKIAGVLELDERKVLLKNATINFPEARLKLNASWEPAAIDSIYKLEAQAEASDLGMYLTRLGFNNDLLKTPGTIDGSIAWKDLSSLEGSLKVDAGPGFIEGLKPGFGRILMLLDLNKIFERLQLNFKDLKHFPFSNLNGTIEFSKGRAKTEDLMLKNAQANILFQGTTDLLQKNLVGMLEVKPHLTGLPLMASFVANPAIGAAVWLIKELGRADILPSPSLFYYEVSGTWDAPKVLKINKEKK